MQEKTVSVSSNISESKNPATGDLLAQIPLHSVEDLIHIVDAARTAQRSWEKLTFSEKGKYLLKVRDYIVENIDDIADTISKDNGKVRIDALAAEVLPIAMAITYFCRNGRKFLANKKLKSGNIFLSNKRSFIRKIPRGVVGIISPWNYPFTIPMFDVITGLLSGNAVILKVATETQLVGLKIKEAFEYADLPGNLFNLINMPGSVIGNAFLENGIDKLFFTGSVSVGKKLTAKAAETLTPVTLELGGNDAMIILDDANLDRTAAGAIWAGFQNAGQSCGGIERIYVHESIYDAFLEKLKIGVENLRVNYDYDFSSDMGCMTTTKQFSVVQKHIDDALAKGAKVFAKSTITASKNLSNFLPALVLVDVNHEMLIMKEETFGPVVGVMKFRTEQEAVELANDSYLGLTASVWSKNQKRAIEVGKRINAGVININDHLMSHGLAETPWGGFKQSGSGHTHGESGFIEMTRQQVIVKDLLHFLKKEIWWHPYSKKVYDGLKGILELLYAKKYTTKLWGFRKFLQIIPRTFKNIKY